MRKLPQVTPGEVPSGGFRSLDPEDRLDGWIIGTIELGSWLIPREGGSTLRDSPEALLLEADLPALPLSDPKALDEIASGTLSGLSIEFHATQESRDGEIRVVEKADLAGIGLVASPSYPNFAESRPERQGHFPQASLGITPLHVSVMGEVRPGRLGKG